MKTNKYILLLVTILAFTFACDDDGGDSKLDLIEFAAIDINKSEGTDAFIDLVKVGQNEVISLGFSADLIQGNPAKTDVMGILVTAAGPVYNAMLFEDIQLPQDYTLTTDDIVAAFAELDSPTDLALGDVLHISMRYTLTNGFVVDVIDTDGSAGTDTNYQTSVLFNHVISYSVSCPSDISGNYTVVSSGFSTDSGPVNNPLVNFSYDVTLTDVGGGTYEISDGVAGVYIDWYSIYGYTFETTGSVTDICGTLSGSWQDAFGSTIELTGIVNADNTLTVQWKNGFGDEVTEAIYTPK
jgi:hypothetical protein